MTGLLDMEMTARLLIDVKEARPHDWVGRPDGGAQR
jgi:hypothetical protein